MNISFEFGNEILIGTYDLPLRSILKQLSTIWFDKKQQFQVKISNGSFCNSLDPLDRTRPSECDCIASKVQKTSFFFKKIIKKYVI